MLEIFSYWLFLFFLFNVIGWSLECTIESLWHKRLINRGFLKGPYIPIYGIGGIMMAFVGLGLRHNGFLVYITGMLAATLLEYMVGSILERAFKKQFWDYSMLQFTYKNRISLMSSMFWGVLTLFQTYVLYDIVSPLAHAVPLNLRSAICAVMTMVMGIDALIQIKRQINIEKLLAKLSIEKVRENLLRTIYRLGNPRQIRDAAKILFKIRNDNAPEKSENKSEKNEDNIK